MDRKIFDNCLEVLRNYVSKSFTPERCLIDLVNNCPELQNLPGNYLMKVYWPEFIGDEVGCTVQEGYLLYKYSIGPFEKFVATKSLTSTVVRHLDQVYSDYRGAQSAIDEFEEKIGWR